MNLYLVHCGYYNHEVGAGIYESHTNFFVVADDFQSARLKAKQNETFQRLNMHIDGIEHIQAVEGHAVRLENQPELNDRTVIERFRHRDLAKVAKVDKSKPPVIQ